MRAILPKGLLGGLAIVLAAATCGSDRVQIISGISGWGADGGGSLDGAAPPLACPAALADRLTVVSVTVDKNIAWQKDGYDGFPFDERVALSVQPDGQAQVAWMEIHPASPANGEQLPPLGVHITPLDANLARRGTDVVMPTAREVSGLVAHDDGFALLTRDQNPGTKLDLGESESDTVAFLVRYQDGREQWKEPLTGSTSLDADQTATLYSPFMEGQLVWNDATYGAYFVVRGGQGDGQEGFYRDALVFRDSQGLPAYWSLAGGCDNNGGIRLIPDSGKTNLVRSTWSRIPQITGLCIQQIPRSLRFTDFESNRLVSDQEVGWSGYSGARLGSLLKIPGGYLVFWLSLGSTNEGTGHDIRMARLDESFNVVSGPTWFGARTPGREEWNLHVAPYGSDSDRFLMVYNEITITGSALSNNAVYTGELLGTHLVLLDANGNRLMDELVQGAPTTMNGEPVVLPGGDVAWAFVNRTPDYNTLITGPNRAGQTALHFARVRYCQ